MSVNDYSRDVSLPNGGACICSDAKCRNPIPGIHVMRINVRPSARMIHHPVEDGGKRFDNKVIEPVVITATCRLKFDEYQEISFDFNEMLTNRDYKFYSIITKIETYENLSLTPCPHGELPEKFDVYDFELQFTEVILGGRKTLGFPSDLDNSSTTSH